jgi:hypothetical protein
MQHKHSYICLVCYWRGWKKTYLKSHFHVSCFGPPWRWMQQAPSICRYLRNLPVKTESCPLWIPHISHINNNVKSRVPSSQEKILISASTTPFVLRVSVRLSGRFICLPLSVWISLHSSWPCPLPSFHLSNHYCHVFTPSITKIRSIQHWDTKLIWWKHSVQYGHKLQKHIR